MNAFIAAIAAALLGLLGAAAPSIAEQEASDTESTNESSRVSLSELNLRAVQVNETREELKQQEEQLSRVTRDLGRGSGATDVRVRRLAAEQQRLLEEAWAIEELMEDLDREEWPSLRDRLLAKQAEYEAAWRRMRELEEQQRLARQAHEERRRQRNALWTTTIRD